MNIEIIQNAQKAQCSTGIRLKIKWAIRRVVSRNRINQVICLTSEKILKTESKNLADSRRTLAGWKSANRLRIAVPLDKRKIRSACVRRHSQAGLRVF
ncbi:hypothetical protein [Caballeronia sp. LZ035]|uniref:hypothetical protein n=1 Tax=Caballeronia sp. LZ035 TaxID=3038568 RepID=UPI00285B2911|nr:hypothetical protein [Caballeronia sp. LZ035]MDR5762384.1 hypothetical protein [Caballeronia sp. LZ035]